MCGSGKVEEETLFVVEYDEFGRKWKALLNEQSGVKGAGERKFVRMGIESKWHYWGRGGRSGLSGNG